MSFVGFRGIERVELRNKWLVFHPGPPRREFEPPAILRFLSLAKADGVEVLDFAQRHGPLGLCIHGLPLFHPSEPESPYPLAQVESRSCRFLLDDKEPGLVEPWRRWCDYARWASALVKLSQCSACEGGAGRSRALAGRASVSSPAGTCALRHVDGRCGLCDAHAGSGYEQQKKTRRIH